MLYDKQTGQKVDIPPEQMAQAVQSGKYGPDPSSIIMMDDGNGNIVPVNGQEAAKSLNDPYSMQQPATDQQVENKNSQNTYGTIPQKALTLGEHAVNMATLGFGKPLISKTIGVVSGQDAQAQYNKDAQARDRENPGVGLTGDVAGIFGDGLGLLGGVGKIGSAAEGIATPLIENTLGNGLIGSTAKVGTKLATEGAIFGGSFEAGRQANDDLPWAPDAILDSAKGGAIDMLKYGLPLHGAVEALTSGISAVKGAAKGFMDKSIGASGADVGESISQVGRDDLKTVSPNDPSNPGNSSAVAFTRNSDGDLVYNNGKRTVTTPPITGKGLETYNPESLQKTGQELGIRDLDLKYKLLKEPVESNGDFLIDMKKNQLAENWLSSNLSNLSDADRVSFQRSQEIMNIVKSSPEMTPQTASLYRQAIDENSRLVDQYAMAKQTVSSNGEAMTGEALAYQDSNAEKDVNTYLKGLDYIDDGKNVHIFNKNVLPESMNAIKNSTVTSDISAESVGVKKQYGVKEKTVDRMGGNEEFDKASQALLDHYPNKMSKISDIGTSYDYITKGLKQSLDNATDNLQDSVERAYNAADQLGIKSGVNNQTIANYIEDKILPQYMDKLTGNPLAGQSTAFNAVKNLADEFRNTNYTTNKYGMRDYQDINIRDLWAERKRADKLSKWDGVTDTAITNTWKNLRFFVDDQVVSAMKNIPEGSKYAQDYLDAKDKWRTLNNASNIAGAAAKKALDKKGNLLGDLKGGMLGNAIGGPLGMAVGYLAGDPMQFITNNSGNIQSYFARNMTDGLQSFDQKASSAISGFFSKTAGKLAPMVKFDTNSSENVLKKDAKRFQQELGNREQFASNFISLNNTMFDLAPNSSNGLLQTVFKARDFLSSKLPKNPYEGIPYRENQWAPNPQDVSKYLRYREAVERPSSIIKQIQNGYVTPEATEVLDQVYPGTKQLLAQKIMEKIALQKDIPQEKRVMIYKVFGIPLDTLTSGALFSQMQSNASNMIATEAQEAQGGKPINTSKITDPMKNVTQGTGTLQEQN